MSLTDATIPAVLRELKRRDGLIPFHSGHSIDYRAIACIEECEAEIKRLRAWIRVIDPDGSIDAARATDE